MLSIEPIARVVVNAARTSAAPSVFDTGLLLIKDSGYAAAKRLKAYTSGTDAAAGLIADGFAATTEAYKAAVKYFAASPAPGKLLVSCYPSSETPAQALSAVLDETDGFYGIALGGIDSRAHKLGAAGLIMAIVGGALLTPWMAEIIGNANSAWTRLVPMFSGDWDTNLKLTQASLRASFVVPAICFAVVLAYALIFSKGKKS